MYIIILYFGKFGTSFLFMLRRKRKEAKENAKQLKSSCFLHTRQSFTNYCKHDPGHQVRCRFSHAMTFGA
jgi:hypothetical protein